MSEIKLKDFILDDIPDPKKESNYIKRTTWVWFYGRMG